MNSWLILLIHQPCKSELFTDKLAFDIILLKIMFDYSVCIELWRTMTCCSVCKIGQSTNGNTVAQDFKNTFMFYKKISFISLHFQNFVCIWLIVFHTTPSNSNLFTRKLAFHNTLLKIMVNYSICVKLWRKIACYFIFKVGQRSNGNAIDRL